MGREEGGGVAEEEEEEEEEEVGMGFGSWEEQMYWSHFQYTHFSRLLLPGCDKSLAVPEQFSRHMRRKLPETVGLKGPSGITWKVGLMARGRTMYFARGWEEFVNDHSLRENDLLVFKYDGDSTFEVTMFDMRSFCEKPATYFVRKRADNGELRNGGFSLRRKTWNSSCPVLFDDAGTSQTYDSDEVDEPPEAWPTKLVVALKATKSKEKNKLYDVVDLPDSGNASPDNQEIVKEIDVKLLYPDSVHLTTHRWSGKVVTQRDRRAALARAEAAISKKGFTIVMIPSRLTVKGRYLARIPAWITKNIAISEKQVVILRMNSNSWPVKLIHRVIKDKHSGKGGSFSGFCGGWRNFVRDNNFQEYDVCAFEPVVAETSSIVLSVQIFRVEDHDS